jgi:hypothetical protein
VQRGEKCVFETAEKMLIKHILIHVAARPQVLLHPKKDKGNEVMEEIITLTLIDRYV